MKILKFKNREEWLAGRIGKITGSRLKDIIVKKEMEKSSVITNLSPNDLR